MAEYQSSFDNQEFENWLKCSIALKIARSGLLEFIKQEINVFHRKILRKVFTINNLATGSSCSSCQTKNAVKCPVKTICNRREGRCSFHDVPFKTCQNKICDTLAIEIESNHRFSGPSWKNTDASMWCHNSWEIAKCFCPPDGYFDISSAENTDFNGLVSILLNCLHFDSLIKDDLSKKRNICTRVSFCNLV